MILMFTVERYIAVAYPLHSLYWCRPSRARKIILATILFALCLTFPTFLENKIVFNWDSASNTTRPQLTETELYPNFDLYKLIYFWLIAVTVQFIPLTILIILNSILMKFIHGSMKNKSKNKKYEYNELQKSSANDVQPDAKSNASQMVVYSAEQKANKKSVTLSLPEATRTKRNSTFDATQDGSRLGVQKMSLGNEATGSMLKLNAPKSVQMRVHRSSSAQPQGDQNKVTILIIATVLVFLICQLPSALLLIYEAIFPLQNQNSKMAEDVILGLNNIANGLTAINASVNFILYSSFSEKFRQTFKELFFNKKKEQPKIVNYNVNKNFARTDGLK